MNKLNRFLLMLIAMVAIMIMAAGVDRGMKYLEQKKWDSEREVFYEQSKADIAQMQTTIQTLSQDREALLAYMEENGLNYTEIRDVVETEREDVIGNAEESDTEDGAQNEESGMVSDQELMEMESGHESISDNAFLDETVSGNEIPDQDVSGNSVSGNTISGNSIEDNSVSGNSVSGNSISGNSVSDNSVSGNSVSANGVELKELCASYEDTIKMNHQDKKIIADSKIDFSDKKIVCLGDSITAAANLENMENYQQMSYPYQLGQILKAREVVNLGIGGSSIGRYWNDAFVDRYQEIPEDADIILVMGGTNDGFCASDKELGSLQERKTGTFAGDLDELLRKLKEDYPDATIVLATPLSNVLHDMLRKDRDYLLPQSSFVKVMKQLAAEYEIPVVDLYNSNFLNSHDAAVIYNFIPDGVHGNELGYQILAEHFAAELIRILEAEEDSEGALANEQRL